MKRRAEKYLVIGGAIWNIIAAALTIFGYAGWFREEGMSRFHLQDQVTYANSSLLDSLVHVVMIYGIFILIIGIVNLYVAKFLDNQLIDKRIMIWLGICTAISFLSFDVIGIFFYLAALVIYVARNKALKRV